MAGSKVETLVTSTPFAVARVKRLASHDRSTLELRGEGRLQCLWGRSQQDRFLLQEKADRIIGCGAHKGNWLRFTCLHH